ncbi:MAG: hypothetical protein ACXVP0_11450, partial [Bacteroidia bacterium]
MPPIRIIVFFLLFPFIVFCQKRSFNPGDKVSMEVDIYGAEGEKTTVPITAGKYTLLYYYHWKDK